MLMLKLMNQKLTSTGYDSTSKLSKPFNPETLISFSLPDSEEVSLKVYNVKGRLVKTLIYEELFLPSVHQVVWSGKDTGGNEAACGVFYKLENDSVSLFQKMILIK